MLNEKELTLLFVLFLLLAIISTPGKTLWSSKLDNLKAKD